MCGSHGRGVRHSRTKRRMTQYAFAQSTNWVASGAVPGGDVSGIPGAAAPGDVSGVLGAAAPGETLRLNDLLRRGRAGERSETAMPRDTTPREPAQCH